MVQARQGEAKGSRRGKWPPMIRRPRHAHGHQGHGGATPSSNMNIPRSGKRGRAACTAGGSRHVQATGPLWCVRGCACACARGTSPPAHVPGEQGRVSEARAQRSPAVSWGGGGGGEGAEMMNSPRRTAGIASGRWCSRSAATVAGHQLRASRQQPPAHTRLEGCGQSLGGGVLCGRTTCAGTRGCRWLPKRVCALHTCTSACPICKLTPDCLCNPSPLVVG